MLRMASKLETFLFQLGSQTHTQRAASALIAVVVVVSAALALIAVVVAAGVASVQTVLANNKPRLTNGLLHFEKAGKHLFFVPEIPDWIVVNSNSAYLLFSCDGAHTEDEIFDAVGLKEEKRHDAYNLFNEARSRGILKSDMPLNLVLEQSCVCSDAPSNPPRNALLRTVYLKLTDECNLRCNYCYAGSGKASNVLTIDTLRKIAKQVAEISPTVEYVMTGGEPLLHAHALDFAEEVNNLGNTVHILTNGVLINTDEIAQKIADVTKLVKISVDGTTEAIHSLSRGKNNLKQVEYGINLLIKHGANVQVAMTVTKKNVHDLANMNAKWGSYLTLQPLFKIGRGKGKSNIALTGEEYYRAMDEVQNIAPLGNVASVLEGLRGRGVKKCALAEREISISETGDVYPCQLLHFPEFLAGNIHIDNLPDIYFNNTILNNLRKVNVDTIEECSKCSIRLICAGGCRARDYSESGSIKNVGDFCEYEKLALINGLLDYSDFSAKEPV